MLEPGSSRHLLVVDDDPDFAAMPTGTLRDHQERLTMADASAPDLGSLRRRKLCIYGAGSFLFGYIVLHPVAMSIFRALDAVHMHRHGPASAHGVLAALAESFHPEMIPMGLLFGFFCAAVGLTLGYQRAALEHQRGRLAAQLAETERYRAELERTVAALRELDRTNRRATRFMVHDFKNHLAIIIGSADMMSELELLDAAERDEALARIGRQARRMLAGVSDLLDLARLDGGAALRLSRRTPAEILAEAATDVSLPLRESHLELGQSHRTLPAIAVDARLITRALVNLAINAFNHNPRGTHVTVDAVADPAEGETVFSCRDDGDGIPPDLLGSLFDEFSTGGGSSSGLGLAFCKSAVEAHGGRIWCESAPGGGTTFYFSIPRQTALDDAAQQLLRRGASSASPATTIAERRDAVLARDAASEPAS